MVLVRVRSQGDAAFRNAIVPWIVDAARPVAASLEALVAELREDVVQRILMRRVDVGTRDARRFPVTVGEVDAQFDFFLGDRRIDLSAPGGSLNLKPGTEVLMLPKGERPRAAAGDGAGERGDIAAPHTAAHLRRTPARLANANANAEARGGGGGDSGWRGTWQGSSPGAAEAEGRGEAAAEVGQLRSQLEKFLARHHLQHLSVRLAAMGVHTLGALCACTADDIGPLLHHDRVLAYHFVTAAHEEMKREHMRIDWAARLRALYRKYNSSKVEQVPALLAAYADEEEQLWISIREKYEAEVAAIAGTEFWRTEAAVATPQRQRQQKGDGATPGNVSARDDADGVVAQRSDLPLTALRCPACSHRFTAPTTAAAEAAHMEELAQLQRELDGEREANKVLLVENTATITRLTNQLADAQALSRHFQSICREQEEWLSILERRLRMGGSPASCEGNAGANVAGERFDPVGISESLSASTPVAAAPGRVAVVAAPAVTPPAVVQRVRKKLADFYIKHAPERLERIDAAMQQWAGREGDLERLIAIEPALLRLGTQKDL